MKKSKLIWLIISLFFFSSILSFNNVNAKIKRTGNNNFNITTGNDLRDLIYDSNSSYWNQKTITAPKTININIDNNITIDSPLYYGLNSNMKNINIDFKGHTFFVKSQGNSSFVVNPDEKKKITVSNLKMGGDTITSNSVSNIPNPSGTGTTSGYYTTFYGMLFQGDFGKSSNTSTSNTEVTYNNVQYNFPDDLAYSQPFTMYYLTLNFTGNNIIISKPSNQEFGEISNIRVKSGKTVLQGGTGNPSSNFGGRRAMISPYYNHINNDSFNIDIHKSAQLDLINNSLSPMFNFANNSNKINVTNNGMFNMISFGDILNNSINKGSSGFNLNAGENSETNIKSINNYPFNTMDNYSFSANLAKKSKTSLISKKQFFFSNNNWTNNINIASRAKLLTYSGSPSINSFGGLINSSNNNNFNFNFIKPATALGFSKDNLKNIIPENADSYDNKSIKYSDYNLVDGIININNLIDRGDQGMLISNYPKTYLSSTEENKTKLNKSENDTNNILNKVEQGYEDEPGDSLSFKTNVMIDSKSVAFENFIFNQPIPSSMDNDTIRISKDGGKNYTKLKNYANSEITDDNGKTKDLKLTDINGDYHNNSLKEQNIIIKGILKGDSKSNTDSISTKSSLIGTGDFDDYSQESNSLNINYEIRAVQIRVHSMKFRNTARIHKGKKLPLMNSSSGYDVDIKDNRKNKKGNVKLYLKISSNNFTNSNGKQFAGDILYKNQSIYNKYVCIMDTNKPKSFKFINFELNPLEDEINPGKYKVSTNWKIIYSN